EDDDRFHDKGTFEKTMRLRLSSVMVQVPEDLRSGIESYANTQIRSLYQEWKKRHESYHDRILRSARIELSNALVFRREDKEDDRFHHQGKFREALLERTIEIMVKAPEDLRNQLELSTEEKIRELYDKWQKEHETYHVRTLQEARREISRELILTAHDRENEDFENQNLFKQHMRNRVAGIMNRLPDDLKKDMDFYLEEKLEGLYEEWRLEKFILSTREPSRKMEPKEKTEKTVDQLSSLYEAAALVHGKEALDGCFIARRSGSSGGISRHSSTPFFSGGQQGSTQVISGNSARVFREASHPHMRCFRLSWAHTRDSSGPFRLNVSLLRSGKNLQEGSKGFR
ncbi:MAG: hypothetical protein U1C97_03195, partial [Candidatus Gracilibacteria bacterium]|nr:hypothetical protein [Candidatus Gracilibacteria bacterium]